MRHLTITAGLCSVALSAAAHVPFVEEHDFTAESPYVVKDVANSKSIYAALSTAGDVDVYELTIDAPMRLFVSSNIPLCKEYREFTVSLALIGPGLPAPAEALPLAPGPGEGALTIRESFATPADREVYLEPNAGKQSWVGPDIVVDDARAGRYRVLVWDPAGRTGDYTLVIGEDERFGPAEIAQTKATMPKLDGGRNLLVDCDPAAPDFDPRR